jgi:CheY-like chemotaxis protein
VKQANSVQQEEKEVIPVSCGETVLVVEDEPAILKMITMMLEKMGYTVLSADRPNKAIQLAEKHADGIDLLLSDVIMPEMNGRELAERIQSLCPNMKNVFMSGFTADVIAHRGVLDSGVHFIQKPFSVMDLAVKMRDALSET